MKVTRGSATVRYYPTPSKGYESWTVVWRTSVGRQTKRFPKRAEAEAFAKEKVAELAEGYHFAVTGELRASIARATELLKPTGKPLELVAGEYAEAHKSTGGKSLSEIVSFWKLHHVECEKKPVDVMEELIQARKQDGCSEVHLKDLGCRLRKFAADFNVNLSVITAPQITDWLRGLKGDDKEPMSARSKKNYRITLNNLFEFAKERRYLSKAWDEMESVPVPKVPKAPIEIFTPAEMQTLLGAARERLRPYLAVSAFAGLRHAEIQRLDWADVKLEERKILVRERVDSVRNKTGKRTVPILPNLHAWLMEWARKTGPVVALDNIANPLRIVGKRVGGWRHNAPRHSFISYRVAQLKRIEEVAMEAGNSKRTIQKDYLEVEMPDGTLIGEEEAAEWFGIKPG